MSYTKIYYDDIWEVTEKGSLKCKDWLPELQDLSKSFNAFVASDSFKGQAASNMKNYLEQVHGILIAIIGSVVQSYQAHAIDYYGGYGRIVDSGDGGEFNLRYTTIISSEVSATGSIQRKLNDIIRSAEQVANDANSVKNSISDLVSIAAYPHTYNLYEQINAAKSKAQTVHDNAIAYEASRANDFNEIDRLITQALLIINSQLGKTRIPVIEYQSGSIGTMCDIQQVSVDLEATAEKIKTITENEYFEEDANLVLNRQALIEEEEKASREWVSWVAIGVGILGSIALTVVTAGAAGPGLCAVVGAGIGMVTAATNSIAENYIEHGSLFGGMDWKEFGKDILVGGVGGAAGGFLGKVSWGSSIKQPIQKGLTGFGRAFITEGSKGVTATTWEIFETAYEVGEAVIKKKPGDEIWSVVDAGLDEMQEEVLKTGENILVEGVKNFAGDYIAGTFDIDAADKSTLRKIGEKVAENAGVEFAGGVAKTTWDVGEAVLDNDSSTTVVSALKSGAKETIQNVAKGTMESVVSGFGEGVTDKIDNKAGKFVSDTITGTVGDTAGNVIEGVTGRTMDYIFGDEKDAGKILGDIWEEDLDSGKSIFEGVAESAVEATEERIKDTEYFKKQEHYNEMNKLDKDHDGKIEVVQFGDYAVTKQDYEAAVENAGKGAYKNQTAQEILGLSRDTDLSSGKHQTVDIDYTREHSDDEPFTNTVTVDGKYVFTKDYYDSTLNAAGTKEYEGRSVREMLDIPEDTKLRDNIEIDTVRTDSIGRDKDVQLHKQSGTNATKIDISTTSRQDEEKAEKLAKEIAKELNKNIKNYKFDNK